MLKNNAFSGDRPPLIASGASMVGGSFGSQCVDNTIEVEKYINDYRLLEIRCGVLEEER
jgi:hypothetical protein